VWGYIRPGENNTIMIMSEFDIDLHSLANDILKNKDVIEALEKADRWEWEPGKTWEYFIPRGPESLYDIRERHFREMMNLISPSWNELGL
jgi:hypothetical protein